MSYTASILLAPNSHMTLEEAEIKLANFFSKIPSPYSIEIVRSDKKLRLTVDNWSLYIYLNLETDVLEESQEMAEMFAKNHPKKAAIATCDWRFEIITEPDNNFDYFNDYMLVLQELSDSPGAFVFDHTGTSFI